MKQLLAALVLFVLSSSALGAAPQPGLWWSPSESGRGYSIDSQGGILVLTVFAYGYDGRMQWYYADGPLSADGTRWSGSLLKFDHGQPMNGSYRAPTASGTDGPVSIVFTSRTTGTITLPGGGTVAIQRQNFGVGGPPSALLGEWLFAYSIGTSSYADRYRFTIVGNSTSSGNGVVVDTGRRAGFEYQVSGSFAGQVIGFRYTASGTVLDQYLFTLQLEEGRGNWVSPATFNQYGMNAYKTHTPSGMAKTMPSGYAKDLEAKGRPLDQGISIAEMAEHDPELAGIALQMWEIMHK